MEIPEVLTDLTVEALREARSGLVSEFTTLLDAAGDAPTEAQISEAEGLRSNIERIDAEFTRRNDIAQRAASLRSFSTEPPVEEAPAADSEPGAATEAEQPVVSPTGNVNEEGEQAPAVTGGENEQPAEPETPPAQNQVEPNGGTVETSASGGAVTLSNIGQQIARPESPAQRAPLVITAAADVPGFGTGAALNGYEDLANALIDKSRSFPVPQGDGSQEDLRFFGLAQIHKAFPPELTLSARSTVFEVEEAFRFAADESRLPGGSLVAAAGWCAPSDQTYDLPGTGATTDGMLSLPEVAMPRAGIKFSNGPDWADIYTRPDYFFEMTEAQAIAGSFTKPCATIPCPTFDEVRLDAIGMCIKVEFLMEAAYPENVALWMRELQTAWAHRVNIKNINAVNNLIGARTAVGDIGSTAANITNTLGLIAERERTKRRLGRNKTYNVDLPSWVQGAIRADLALRSNRASSAVTDAEIQALFTVHKLNPQWVIGWDDLAEDATDYPATFPVNLYPAGMFIRGTLPVVNLSSVYDAASLAQNVYTGVFFEEGHKVFRRGYGGVALTLSTCNAGRLGALNLTCGA